MPRTISPKRLFREAIGVLRRDHTITIGDAERALSAIASATPALEQAAIVQEFLTSRAAAQLSARAQDALRAFVARGGAGAGGNSVDLRAEAVRDTRDARARVRRAEVRLDALLSRSTSTPAASLAQIDRALERARTDADAARARLAKIASEAGVREAARSLGVASSALDEARDAFKVLQAHARRAPVRRADVDAVKRWLRAPTAELLQAETLLARRRREDDDDSGFYTTAKAPSDSEDQGAHPPHGTGHPGPTGPRSPLERMRRALAGLADDEDDP